MKKNLRMLGISLCLSFTAAAQNPLLSLPSSYLNFSGTLPLPQSPTTPVPTYGYAGGASVNGPHNMYAGADGGPLFFVASDASSSTGTGIYNKHGYRIADLLQNSAGYDVTCESEIAIAPDPGNCAGYYILGADNDDSYAPSDYNFPFYTYVDMSQQSPGPAPTGELGKLIAPSGGAGGNIKNLYDLVPNYGPNNDRPQINSDVAIAITKPRSSDGNSRLVFVNNGYFFYIFKITTSGVSFLYQYDIPNTITNSASGYAGGFDAKVGHPYEMEIFENTSTGRIQLAVTIGNNSYSNRDEIGLFEFSLSTGAYVSNTYRLVCVSNNCGGGTTGLDPHVYGIEFSPNGSYLYFTHTPSNTYTNPVEYVSYSTLSRGALTPSGITMSDYQYSQIEVGLDGKLYLAASNRVSTMSSPNTPTSYTWTNSAISQTIPQVNGTYYLPDQIDQETYGGFYTSTPTCCKTYSTFTIDRPFTMPTGTYTVSAGSVVNGTDSNGNPLSYTFSATTTAKGDIIIPVGATVTFSSMTIQFTKDAGIEIKATTTTGSQGGKLKLIGTTLTYFNTCENELWKGVLVHGYNQAQGTATSSLNGVLTATGTVSQIDHALTAITIEAGGIAQFPGRLYDNHVAIEASTYTPSGSPSFDQSQFTGTTIRTQSTTTLTSAQRPTYLINIVGRQPMMRFTTCTISNDYTSYNNLYDGILSNDANTRLSGCTLSNFRFGVYHTNSSISTARPINVNGSTLNNCYQGVYVGTSNYAYIGSNNFNIIDNTTGCRWPYGLMLDQSSRFTIASNTFKNYSLTTASVSDGTGSGGTTGLIAQNTSINETIDQTVNIIEKNTFLKLNVGVSNAAANYVWLTGSNPHNARGLRYYCNTFTSNIAWEDFLINSGTIDYSQGVASYAAQNNFSHSGSSGDMIYNSTPPSPSEIDYRYDGTGAVVPTIASTYTNYFIASATATGANTNNCTGSAVGSPGGRLLSGPSEILSRISEIKSEMKKNFVVDNPGNPEQAFREGELSQLQTQLVIYYLNDTLSPSPIDSAYKYMLLSTKATNSAQLMDIYLDKGDIAAAQATYASFHNEQAGSNLDKIYEILINSYGQDLAAVLRADTSLLQTVQTIANDTSDIAASRRANSLLNKADPNTYRPKNISMASEGQTERKSSNALELSSPYQLSNYPNPFNGSTTLSAYIPKGSGTAQLIVTDVLGKEVSRYNLTEGTNNLLFDKQEANGLLFYTLYIDGVRKETKLMAKSGQ